MDQGQNLFETLDWMNLEAWSNADVILRLWGAVPTQCFSSLVTDWFFQENQPMLLQLLLGSESKERAPGQVAGFQPGARGVAGTRQDPPEEKPTGTA
jgi:hypothetical protein